MLAGTTAICPSHSETVERTRPPFSGPGMSVTQMMVCRYDAIMDAFGGDAFAVNSSAQLAAACRICFAVMRPALINVTLDPFAGVESGNVHAFNAPKSKV